MKKLLFLIFFSYPSWAMYCITVTTTTINGSVIEVSVTTSCYPDSGGTSSGSGTGTGGSSTTGGGGSGTSTTGSGTSSSGTWNPDKPVKNSSQVVDCLQDIISFTSMEGFDIPRSGGSHQGVDLFAPNGTLVRSPVNGKIILVKDDTLRDTTSENPNVANRIAIQLETGVKDRNGELIEGALIMVQLEHLDPGFQQEFGSIKGRFVRQGDIIARSDNTGQIIGLGPHLHVQYTDTDGNTLDPEATTQNCN